MPINNIVQKESINSIYFRNNTMENPKDNNLQLFNEWKKWENESQKDIKEQRNIAVIRMIECLNKNHAFLDLSSLMLTTLPDRLPSKIEYLDVSKNQLTSLPDNLPSTLVDLYLSKNQLNTLPDNLPINLRQICARENKLTVLPNNFPESLKILYVDNNQLTILPESLPINLKILTISGNPLSKFMRELTSWGSGVDIIKWLKISKEENADVFADFLQKLNRGFNKSSVRFKYTIINWLNNLAKEENKGIREQIFLIAHEASESCVDRASLYFNKMELLMIEDEIIKNKDNDIKDNDINEAVQKIKEIFRMASLEKISAEHSKRRQNSLPGFSEDVEIYLAYQYKLRDKLSLPIHTQLQFEEIANLTEEDLNKARLRVLEEEKNNFFRYLVVESKGWESIIKNWNEEKYENMEDEILEEIDSDKFKNDIDAALGKNGIPITDEDSRRNLIKKMTDDLLYHKKYELTKEFLTEKNMKIL